jgi:hypothetical protein
MAQRSSEHEMMAKEYTVAQLTFIGNNLGELTRYLTQDNPQTCCDKQQQLLSTRYICKTVTYGDIILSDPHHWSLPATITICRV